MFLHQNPHISTIILGADRPMYIKEDIGMLNNFHNKKLLNQALAIINKNQPKQFTEIMGEFYQKD